MASFLSFEELTFWCPSVLVPTHLGSSNNLSRPDPCSVDFGRETPKFLFKNCRGFFGGFFPPVLCPRKKARKNPQKKIHSKIHPGLCSEKFPSDFCRSLFLIIWQVPGYTRSMRAPSCELWRSLVNFGEPSTPCLREPPWHSPEFWWRSPHSPEWRCLLYAAAFSALIN